MHDFKCERLQLILGDSPIPIREVSKPAFLIRVAEILNLPPRTPEGDIALHLYNAGEACRHGPYATDENFDLLRFLREQQLDIPSKVYLYWDQHQPVDEVDLPFLCRYLDDIWYPGSDDLDICDEQFRWILSIAHGGDLKLVRFLNRFNSNTD